jgi:SERRATE/Ars2, N-terminal domain
VLKRLFGFLLLRFRSKYHPDEHDKGQEEARSTLKHRCKVFMKLCELGRVGEVVVDIDHSTELVRLLDAGYCSLELIGVI